VSKESTTSDLAGPVRHLLDAASCKAPRLACLGVGARVDDLHVLRRHAYPVQGEPFSVCAGLVGGYVVARTTRSGVRHSSSGIVSRLRVCESDTDAQISRGIGAPTLEPTANECVVVIEVVTSIKATVCPQRQSWLRGAA
jgi:hypothetical protein